MSPRSLCANIPCISCSSVPHSPISPVFPLSCVLHPPVSALYPVSLMFLCSPCSYIPSVPRVPHVQNMQPHVSPVLSPVQWGWPSSVRTAGGGRHTSGTQSPVGWRWLRGADDPPLPCPGAPPALGGREEGLFRGGGGVMPQDGLGTVPGITFTVPFPGINSRCRSRERVPGITFPVPFPTPKDDGFPVPFSWLTFPVSMPGYHSRV